MILILEDDDTTRELTVAILRLAGHHVVAAADGHDVLAIVRREHPAVIFSDLRMPHVDGRDVRRLLQSLPELAAIPFIIVSAALNIEEEGRALDATETLQKPVHMDDLLRCASSYDSPPNAP